jgi:hypothetical protein
MGILWWKNKPEAKLPQAEPIDPDLVEARLRAAELVVRGHIVSNVLEDRLQRNGFTALAARILAGGNK